MNSTLFDLEQLYQQEFFSDLDYAFAKSLANIFNEENPLVKVSLALASRFVSLGHICVDLKELAGQKQLIKDNDTKTVQFPEEDAWVSALENSSLVSGKIHSPLVLDAGNKLYLARYFDFQQRLIINIVSRLKSNIAPIGMGLANHNQLANQIAQLLEAYFPDKSEHYMPQKLAVRNAVEKPFTIISGGPGTGKTFVIQLIRQILTEHAQKTGAPVPRILCLAPTGKAASKMENGRTIHSALKPLKEGQKFYHNKQNPLHYDIIFIDEASMIDLPLFVRLLEAIPDTAKVILTGDAHQLSAIQAGAVFSDLCKIDALASHRFELEYNFRSQGKTGIEQLSRAIKDSRIESIEKIFLSDQYPDVQFKALDQTASLKDILTETIPAGYNPLLRAESVEQALANADSFRVLCAHHQGSFGTVQINPVCENILHSYKNFDMQPEGFCRLIMIKVNDYKKELFNGDTGLIVEQNGERTAFFKKADNQIKSFRYSDLPSHEPAFAITIHKSQGSEFDTVLIIIPDKFSPVVTRELLYTGVTRARKKVIIAGNHETIKNAIQVDVKRYSGIEDHMTDIDQTYIGEI
jgi:exodeoxyribonuclease V alpha subunit